MTAAYALDPRLTVADAARIMRESVKDKSYRAYPLGQRAARYLRANRQRFTKDTYRDYESCLDKFARFFADLDIHDFEPPVGTERMEEFLDWQWGSAAGRTFNKNHSVMAEFFKFWRYRGELHGDPMLGIRRAKKRGVHRETFSATERNRILAGNRTQPDAFALRLLLIYGLRKGALQAVQFRHFDFARQELTIFTKGGKVQAVPVDDQAFWADLDVYMRQTQAEPHHYLLCRTKTAPKAFVNGKASEFRVIEFRDKPRGTHGLHDWWYRCLAQAGIVPPQTTAGERMHKARHSAGQRLLDATGNLKAVQALLGHESIETTGDHYTDWDNDQLRESLRTAAEREDE